MLAKKYEFYEIKTSKDLSELASIVSNLSEEQKKEIVVSRVIDAPTFMPQVGLRFIQDGVHKSYTFDTSLLKEAIGCPILKKIIPVNLSF